jgi:hypothetical protein
MLSDTIFDNLYHPSGPGTAKDRVRWFLEDLDHYDKPSFVYDEKHLAILRDLAKAYLRHPSFVTLQNLQSALAFMRAMDASPSTYDEFGCRLVIQDGELWFIRIGCYSCILPKFIRQCGFGRFNSRNIGVHISVAPRTGGGRQIDYRSLPRAL